mmetsp:Transcript_6586/g.21213  ORF Transcript_6586/g.21213 Transcript_6586/m.21213 type:complete len:457 (+) Transcript_6586:566-1936(+)
MAKRGGGGEACLAIGRPLELMRLARGVDAEGCSQALGPLSIHVRAAAAVPEGEPELALVGAHLPARGAGAALGAGLVDVVLDALVAPEHGRVAAAALVVELAVVPPVCAVVAEVLPVPAEAAAAVLLGDADEVVQLNHGLACGALVGVDAAGGARGHLAGLGAVGAEATLQHLAEGLVELVRVGHAHAHVPPPPPTPRGKLAGLLLAEEPGGLDGTRPLLGELQVGAEPAQGEPVVRLCEGPPAVCTLLDPDDVAKVPVVRGPRGLALDEVGTASEVHVVANRADRAVGVPHVRVDAHDHLDAVDARLRADQGLVAVVVSDVLPHDVRVQVVDDAADGSHVDVCETMLEIRLPHGAEELELQGWVPGGCRLCLAPSYLLLVTADLCDALLQRVKRAPALDPYLGLCALLIVGQRRLDIFGCGCRLHQEQGRKGAEPCEVGRHGDALLPIVVLGPIH